MLWPRLMYPLVATTFTKRECAYIMAPALKAGLAASGVVGTFPRVITHGTPNAFGLGIWDLYIAQGWAHLNACLRYGPDPTSISGALIRCSLETAKMELGLPLSIFQYDYGTLGHLVTPAWIIAVWRLVSDFQLVLQDPTPNLQLHREHDHFLTQLFLDSGYRKGDLRALNRCRLYLQVTTLTDITTGCGRYITPKTIQGQFEPDIPRCTRWPIQGRPGSSDWGIWRQALQRLCPAFKLHHPLGRWLDPAPLLAWHYSPSQDRLYRQILPNCWLYHVSTSRRAGRATHRRFNTEGRSIPVTELPRDLLRGHAVTTNTQVIGTGFAPSLPRSNPAYNSLLQYIESTSPQAMFAFESFQYDPNLISLGLFSTPGCIAVSDGSFQEQRGAASWILSTLTGNPIASSSLLVPGLPEIQSPLRSEIAGIYAIVLFTHLTCQFYKITTGSLEIGCESLSAIRLCSGRRPSNPSTPNYDLLQATRALSKLTPISWHYRHIPGHKDRSTLGPLALRPHLNTIADSKAREHLRSPTVPRHHKSPLLGETWVLSTSEYKVTSLERSRFLAMLTLQRSLHYWIRRKKILANSEPTLAHVALGAALQDLPWSRRIWIVKQTSGFCAGGRQMFRYRKWTHDKCPRCGAPEDSAHILLCQASHMAALWEKELKALSDWMDSKSTDPVLLDYILLQLHSWRSVEPNSTPPHPSIAEAASAQARLGWDAFVNGFLASQWAATQQRYYNWLQKGKTV